MVPQPPFSISEGLRVLLSFGGSVYQCILVCVISFLFKGFLLLRESFPLM